MKLLLSILLLSLFSPTDAFIILGTCNCTSIQPLMSGKFSTVGEECFERGICRRVVDSSRLMIWWHPSYRPANSYRKWARPHMSYDGQQYYDKNKVDVWKQFNVTCDNGIWKVGYFPYNISYFETGTNKELTMLPDAVNKLGLKHELRFVGCFYQY